MNITDSKKEEQLTPLLRLGFRPLFLFGSLFALAAMAIWTLTLAGTISPTPLNGAFWWHSHEMLFGFVPAIIAGFLLTAVQSWTGVPAIKGNKLLLLVLVWAVARLLILANTSIPIHIIMAIDLFFLPLTGLFLALPLFKIKQYRNMMFGFVSILLAALVRTLLLVILPEYVVQLWLISGSFWCIAFACFIWVYLPILSAPRVDGRPG